ncbi:MAG: energy-coupling factor transporter ATPase, partial [Oscillospiraceae bacterium]|nr:energy-coupling factor transporter ATPase [Oscillospiraceae bacterium]
EPTAMLDPVGRQEVISTIHRLCREKNITVILITHHMDECTDADRLVVMSNGKIVLDGKPIEVFRNVEQMEQEGLDVPETMRILYDLNLIGEELPPDVLQMERCAEYIAAAMRTREQKAWQR